jgi:phage tail protein X
VKHLALCAVLSGCLSPANRTATLAVAATGALVADWVQTRGIVEHCSEANPVLGACGQRFPVDLYFPLVIMGTVVLASQVPQWGDAVYGAVFGIEAATVWQNARQP